MKWEDRWVAKWAAIGAVAAVAGTALMFSLLSLAYPTPSWTERTVTLQGQPVAPIVENVPCYFWVNSSAHADRFCLHLYAGSAGYLLDVTLDHGNGTASFTTSFGSGPPCQGYCKTSVSWIAPDGTGMLYWPFNHTVTIGALD